LRRGSGQDWPAAVLATHYGFAQHASDHRAAAPAAARTRANSGAFAYLLKSFRARLNGLEHGAFANLIAQAGRLEVLDDRLFSGFPF
jgi:hypothetical protein